MRKLELLFFALLVIFFASNVSGTLPSNRSYSIETLVFADYSVHDRFPSSHEAKTYVVSLMNLADKLYHHDSLGMNINIAVQDVIWVSKEESRQILRGISLNRSVHRFCNWVLRNYYLKYNYDHAIFISRNIHQAAGISPLNQMCNVRYSCTLVEDSGFFSAYPIAHELMHSLSIEHDGEGNSCDKSGRSGNIMAPLVQSTRETHHWSQCTRDTLQRVIDADRFYCIRDFPVIQRQFRMSGQPGWYWSANQQCEILLGRNLSRLCPSGHDSDSCRQLWCTDVDNPYRCNQMINHGLLDGTVCGFGMECQGGHCIPRSGPPRDENGWGLFTPWTGCSRSCGGGTRYRKRKCHRRDENGTALCTGTKEEYELCAQTPCSLPEDVRELQCSRFNDFKLRRRFHTWLPRIIPEKPCQLGCYSLQSGEEFNAWDMVRDGTPCGYEDVDHKCIQGKCVKFDCTGTLGGNATRDRCGVCRGNGTSCILVEHVMHRTVRQRSFDMIYIVPISARQLQVVKTSKSHILGIVDMDRREFIFRGDKVRGNSTRVHHGTSFNYQEDAGEHGTDVVTAKGPILGAILIQTQRTDFTNLDKVRIQIRYLMKITW